MTRKLEWRDEKTFRGWACSGCGWVYSNPSLEIAGAEHSEIVEKKFDTHVCEKHPTR